MYNKVQILLSKSNDMSSALLEENITSIARQCAAFLPQGTVCRSAIRLEDDPIRRIAHSKEFRGSSESFDAVFEVGAEAGDLNQLIIPLRDIIEHLNQWIDPSRSAIIAGTEHVILPGEEPLLLIFAIRRPFRMTDDAYHDYWLNTHAKVARKVPVLRAYRQFHANEGLTQRIGKLLNIGITDFNGAAQGYYRDIEDFLDIMKQPEVTADAIEDEKKFIDHSRSVMGLYRMDLGT